MRIIVTRKKMGRWYILLIAGNGQTVAVTQKYSSFSNAMRAARMLRDSEAWSLEIGDRRLG